MAPLKVRLTSIGSLKRRRYFSLRLLADNLLASGIKRDQPREAWVWQLVSILAGGRGCRSLLQPNVNGSPACYGRDAALVSRVMFPESVRQLLANCGIL